MRALPTDISLQSEVADLVASRCTDIGSPLRNIGALQRNYFSLLFTLDTTASASYVVKIPKTDLRRRPHEGLLPITAEDHLLGRAEYESLRLMAHSWKAEDLRVSWVRPIDYIAEYNAVVTERVDAEEACLPLRKLALRHLGGNLNAGAELNALMARLAVAMRRFHDKHAMLLEFSGERVAARLHEYIQRLKAAGARLPATALVERALDRIARTNFASVETITLKGIDIRNVLVACDGHIWLVDPGKAKRAPREADLARFLFTWRILFWGTAWFPFGMIPRSQAEAAFLRAYDGNDPCDPAPLRVYLLKETLKHWFTAYDSVALKRWPKAKTAIVQRLYIDPFYHRQMVRLLRSFT
jgi:aminoglycoside phosphotransferase (APT) family kinase protein